MAKRTFTSMNEPSSSSSKESNKKYHVFLSFAGDTGRKMAFRICQHTEMSRFKVFIDVKDINQGELVVPACHKGIRKSIIFVPLITDSFIEKPYPLEEVKYTIETHRKAQRDIVPVVIGSGPKDSNNEFLTRLLENNQNKVVVTNMEDLEPIVTQIISTLGGRNIKAEESQDERMMKRLRRTCIPSNKPSFFFVFHRPSDRILVNKIILRCTERVKTNWVTSEMGRPATYPLSEQLFKAGTRLVVKNGNVEGELRIEFGERTKLDVRDDLKKCSAIAVILPTVDSIRKHKVEDEEVELIQLIREMKTGPIKKYLAFSRAEPEYYQNTAYEKCFEEVTAIKKDHSHDDFVAHIIEGLQNIARGEAQPQSLMLTKYEQ